MGNANACFGKKRSSKGTVHPLAVDHRIHRDDQLGVRIKVRMSSGQLKELLRKVDMSKGNTSKLGRLIVQECSKGRLHARVVVVDAAAGEEVSETENKYARGGGLTPIREHSAESDE